MSRINGREGASVSSINVRKRESMSPTNPIRASNPADSPTRHGHEWPPTRQEIKSALFTAHCSPSTAFVHLFTFSLLHPLSTVHCSLFHCLCSLLHFFTRLFCPLSTVHCDLTHGERKIPHFRRIPPSFQNTSSFFYCARKCRLGSELCNSAILRSLWQQKKPSTLRPSAAR
jgi:hypothetical protein